MTVPEGVQHPLADPMDKDGNFQPSQPIEASAKAMLTSWSNGPVR